MVSFPEIGSFQFSRIDDHTYQINQKLNLSLIRRIKELAKAIFFGLVYLCSFGYSSRAFHYRNYFWKLCKQKSFSAKVDKNFLNSGETLKGELYQPKVVANIFKKNGLLNFTIQVKTDPKVELLKEIRSGKVKLRDLSDIQKKDKEIVLAAVETNHKAFLDADVSLRTDQYFIIQLIGLGSEKLKNLEDDDFSSEDVFYFIDDSLKQDLDFVLMVLPINPSNFKFICANLKKDVEFIRNFFTKLNEDAYCADFYLEIFKELEVVFKENKDEFYALKKELILKCLDGNYAKASYFNAPFMDSLKNDKDVINAGIKLFRYSMKDFLPEGFKINKEVFQSIMNKGLGGQLLEFAEDSVKKDENIVFETVKTNGVALEFAHPSLWKNEKIVFAAVKNYGAALEYADPILKSNRKIVKASLSKNSLAFDYADPLFRRDKKLILFAACKDPRALSYVDKDFLKQDKPFIYKLAKRINYYYILEYIDKGFADDLLFMLIAVAQDYAALQFASKRLKDDRGLVLVAVKHYGQAIKFASDRLQKYPGTIEEALKSHPLALQFANKEKPEIGPPKPLDTIEDTFLLDLIRAGGPRQIIADYLIHPGSNPKYVHNITKDYQETYELTKVIKVLLSDNSVVLKNKMTDVAKTAYMRSFFKNGAMDEEEPYYKACHAYFRKMGIKTNVPAPSNEIFRVVAPYFQNE